MFILIVSSIGMLNPATFSTAKKQISKSFLFLFTIVPDCFTLVTVILRKNPLGRWRKGWMGRLGTSSTGKKSTSKSFLFLFSMVYLSSGFIVWGAVDLHREMAACNIILPSPGVRYLTASRWSIHSIFIRSN